MGYRVKGVQTLGEESQGFVLGLSVQGLGCNIEGVVFMVYSVGFSARRGLKIPLRDVEGSRALE